MHNLSVSELVESLRDKKFSCKELVQHFLNRIDSLNPSLNSFITVTSERALEQAENIDALNAQGKMPSNIAGIPIAQKDIFCTKGVKTSCASKMLDNFISPYNSTVVEKCEQAGLIMLGKTNMDEFAMGSSNENSFYGACKNPWDVNSIPGGSSGGSAAAVAARLTPLATGTDTGGSIRQPAALCGVTGLKPTYGRISRYGMVAFASSLDQGGPMAQSAEDIAHFMNIIAGFDAKDSTSVEAEVPDYTESLNKPLDNLKIGIPKEFFNEDLSTEMNNTLLESKKVLEALGAKFVDITLPNVKYAVPVYYVVASAECSSNLSRFDGIRFGFSIDDPKDLKDLYMRSRQQGFGAEVKRRILTGTYALSAGYYDAYYLQAQKVRQLIAQDFRSAFKEVDIIFSPTTPTPAFKLGEKSNDPIQMYLSDIYTIAVNLAGLPAMSVPAGFINELPIGMQLLGNHFSESTLLNVAHCYQNITDWHKKTPKIS